MLATLIDFPARRPGWAQTLPAYFLIILNRIRCQPFAASFGNPGGLFGTLDAGVLDLRVSCSGPVRVKL